MFLITCFESSSPLSHSRICLFPFLISHPPSLQAPLSDQDSMKPPQYSQHYGGQPGYGGIPSDGGFHGPSMVGHMGQQRMQPAGYPPMMRMPGGVGPRPTGMRPGAPGAGVPPQPNNLRLQLQHRLQAQLVGHVSHQLLGQFCDAHRPQTCGGGGGGGL